MLFKHLSLPEWLAYTNCVRTKTMWVTGASRGSCQAQWQLRGQGQNLVPHWSQDGNPTARCTRGSGHLPTETSSQSSQ